MPPDSNAANLEQVAGIYLTLLQPSRFRLLPTLQRRAKQQLAAVEDAALCAVAGTNESLGIRELATRAVERSQWVFPALRRVRNIALAAWLAAWAAADAMHDAVPEAFDGPISVVFFVAISTTYVVAVRAQMAFASAAADFTGVLDGGVSGTMVPRSSLVLLGWVFTLTAFVAVGFIL